MTGPEHYWRAEKFAEEAYKHIGQDDERDIAGAWSALLARVERLERAVFSDKKAS